MIPYIGDFAEDATVYHYFNTFDSNDPSASVTITNLASTDLYVHKNGVDSTETTTGATVDVDFDTQTGIHKVTVDTSADAFYAINADYMVRMEGTTVDGATINAALFTFSIENRFNAAVTDGATLAAGAITDASLAGNMEIVFETDFATNYNTTRNAWATNFTDTIGTHPAVTVSTINSNVINAASIATDAITSDKIAADAIGSSELAATAVNEIADQVWDEDIADHVAVGTFGQAVYLNAYAGPFGPGVYIDDGAANTSTVAGEDGVESKPVSTMAAARTIADAIGIKRYYFTGIASAMDISATTEDWHFVGLTDPTANILDLNSQDVDRSLFQGLTLQGVQAGAARITASDCILRDDPGAGFTDLRIYAIRCGLESADPGIRLLNNDDHIFEACYSMVAGNGTPMIDAQSGANVGLNIRHYSGGIELKGLSGTSSTSVETDGQVVFNATNTTTAPVTIRGNCTVTDNATMTAVTEGARLDRDAIADAVTDEALSGHTTAGTVGKAISDIDTATGTDIPATITTLQADTDDIQTRLPAALVNSRMDCTMDATGFEDAAVDKVWDELMAGHVTSDSAGEVMNDWQDGGRLDLLLDAIKVITDAITTNGSGLSAIPWNAAWDAEVESEVNDAIDTVISELGVAAPTATPTLRTGLMLLYMMARNKLVVQTSGTDALEVYNDAGTKICGKLLTDDGSDFTEAEMA
jgi:hypothetical protein